MKQPAFTKLTIVFGISVMAASLLSGCEDYNTLNGLGGTQTNQCATGGMIVVRDGFYQHLCGCDESAAAGDAPQAPITCTVPVGYTIQFIFEGATVRHQIEPVGSPMLPVSGIYDPYTDGSFDNMHLFKLDAVGTYQFTDSFFPNMNGQIIVR